MLKHVKVGLSAANKCAMVSKSPSKHVRRAKFGIRDLLMAYKYGKNRVCSSIWNTFRDSKTCATVSKSPSKHVRRVNFEDLRTSKLEHFWSTF